MQVPKATTIGSLKNQMCDKNNGNERLTITYKDVPVIPNFAFNLYSVTKRLKNRWKHEGGLKQISIMKDDIKIKLDIFINTPDGILRLLQMGRRLC